MMVMSTRKIITGKKYGGSIEKPYLCIVKT